MNPESPTPLEELKLLDQQIDNAVDLAGLRPIYYKVDDIGRKHPDDVDVQLAVGDIKQRIMQRGNVFTARETGRPELPTQPNPVAGPPGTDDPTVPGEDLPTAVYSVKAFPRPPVNVPAQPPGPAPAPYSGPYIAPHVPATWQPEEKRRSRAGILIGVAALVAATAIVGFLERDRISTLLGMTPRVALQITTAPSGASIHVNGEAKCTSDCELSLPPGTYQIAAMLDGYVPAEEGATLMAGQPAMLQLLLKPQPESLRIVTDLVRGKVVLDNRSAVNLEQGRYVFENLEPGRHKVAVTSPAAAGSFNPAEDASFSFDLTQAKPPAVMGTVVARNLEAVLVASFANRARVLTSSGPWKFAVNGRPAGDAGPAGVDVTGFDAGSEELVIQQGADRRSMKETFGPEPTLTAFLRSDPKGILDVSAGEDDVRVFLNDREYPVRTRQGEVLIPYLGPVTVRVAKNGFEEPPAQVTEVKKGAMVRLEFKMTASRP